MKALLLTATALLLLTACSAEAAPLLEEPAGEKPSFSQVDELIQTGSGEVIEPRFVVWSADGDGVYVASAPGVYFLPADGDAAEEVATLSPSERLLSLSSQGDIAMLQAERTAIVRHASSGEERAVLALNAPINSARFSPDGTRLAVVLDDGARLLIWDVENDLLLQEFMAPDGLEKAYSVEFAADGQSLAWLAPTAVARIVLDDGSTGPVVALADGTSDTSLANDGRFLVANGAALTAWNLTNGVEIDSFAAGGLGRSVTFSSDGEQVLLTSAAGVSVLPASLDASLVELDIDAYDALFSPDADAIVVVGVDGRISVWSLP